MPFSVQPIEVEALRKLERTMRQIARNLTNSQQQREYMAMAELLGTVLDRAEFDNAMKTPREYVK